MKLMIFALAAMTAAPAFGDQRDDVLACVGGMSTDADWATCRVLMFAPCATNKVGNPAHLECLGAEKTAWLARIEADREKLSETLTNDSLGALTDLYGQWIAYVGQKCPAIALQNAATSSEAAQLGCFHSALLCSRRIVRIRAHVIYLRGLNMRLLIVFLLVSLGFVSSANAQQFAISKKKYQQCVLALKPGDKLFRTISEECALPAVEKECRYGGKNSRTIYGDCPEFLVQQMGRWIKKETAQLRKAGGKRAEESEKLMSFIGNANRICLGIGKDNNSADSLNVSFCRAVVLTQTYGMLHYIRVK